MILRLFLVVVVAAAAAAVTAAVVLWSLLLLAIVSTVWYCDAFWLMDQYNSRGFSLNFVSCLFAPPSICGMMVNKHATYETVTIEILMYKVS